MDYKIIEKNAFDIIEKVEAHTVENSENAKSIPDFWTRSHNDGTVKTLLDTTTDRTYIFGVCYGNLPENAKTFDYSIAAKCYARYVAQDYFGVLSYIGLSAHL